MSEAVRYGGKLTCILASFVQGFWHGGLIISRGISMSSSNSLVKYDIASCLTIFDIGSFCKMGKIWVSLSENVTQCTCKQVTKT